MNKPHSLPSPQDCHRLRKELLQLAQDPNQMPEYRKECFRHASNLLFVAKVRAKQNSHPQHPTKQ